MFLGRLLGGRGASSQHMEERAPRIGRHFQPLLGEPKQWAVILRGSSLSGHRSWREHRRPHPPWGGLQLPWNCWELLYADWIAGETREGEGCLDPESLRVTLSSQVQHVAPTYCRGGGGWDTSEHQGLICFHKGRSLWWNALLLIQA